MGAVLRAWEVVGADPNLALCPLKVYLMSRLSLVSGNGSLVMGGANQGSRPLCPGASEPRNMIYMSRLGIWGEGTPFRTFEEFLHAIEKR